MVWFYDVASQKSLNIPFPLQALKKPEVATVISQFTASDVREISLSPGQLIHVLKKDQGGWWQGELQVYTS